VRVKEEHQIKKIDKDETDDSDLHITSPNNITSPKSSDILCGKDKACVAHEGSKWFRKKIALNYERYQACTTKQEKMNITKDIVEELQQTKSSRFLKYDNESNSWREITQMAARDKVSHALRFASQKQEKKKIKKLKREPSVINIPTPLSKKTIKKVLPAKAKAKSISKPRSCFDQVKNNKDTKIWEKFVKRQQELLTKIHNGDMLAIPISQPSYPTSIENYPVYIDVTSIMNGPLLAFEMRGEPTD